MDAAPALFRSCLSGLYVRCLLYCALLPVKIGKCVQIYKIYQISRVYVFPRTITVNLNVKSGRRNVSALFIRLLVDLNIAIRVMNVVILYEKRFII